MTSNSAWNKTTTGTEVANAFSSEILGKRVLLTGVSPKGLGQYTAMQIAHNQPALLILASKDLNKIEDVVSNLPKTTAIVKTVVVDLASQNSVRKATEEIKALTPSLDIIINNAGLNVMEKQATEEGIEMHFGVNHLGHFLLSNLLLPILSRKQNHPARIINLSSEGHIGSPIRFSDPNFQRLWADIPEEERPPGEPMKKFFDENKAYSPYIAYAQSKTANILFSLYLNLMLGNEGLVSYSLHPGAIWTELPRHLDEKGVKLVKDFNSFWKSGDQGVATTLIGAFDPALNKPQGVYLADCQYENAAPFAIDEMAAKRLWAMSEDMVGQKFDLGKFAISR